MVGTYVKYSTEVMSGLFAVATKAGKCYKTNTELPRQPAPPSDSHILFCVNIELYVYSLHTDMCVPEKDV